MPRLSCRKLLMQFVRRAEVFARDRDGSNSAAIMAIMAIPTNSSINVKPLLAWRFPVTLLRTFQRAIAHADASSEPPREPRRAADARLTKTRNPVVGRRGWFAFREPRRVPMGVSWDCKHRIFGPTGHPRRD